MEAINIITKNQDGLRNPSSPSKNRVFVSGVGMLAPGGKGIEQAWKTLQENSAPASKLPGLLSSLFSRDVCYNVPDIDDANLPIKKSVSRFLSPAGKLWMIAATEALAKSGLEAQALYDFGISLGTSNGDRPSDEELGPFLNENNADPSARFIRYINASHRKGAFRALRAQPGLIASNLALLCGSTGPLLTFIDDALAAGIAIGEAFRMVQRDYCPGAITGGTFEVDDPWTYISHKQNSCNKTKISPVASASACLVLESESFVNQRGGEANIEMIGYWSGQSRDVISQSIETANDYDVKLIMSNIAEENDEGELSKKLSKRDGLLREGENIAESFAASPAIYAALATHYLQKCGARSMQSCLENNTGRSAALVINSSRHNVSTAFLLAKI